MRISPESGADIEFLHLLVWRSFRHLTSPLVSNRLRSLLARVLSGRSDANISFTDLITLLRALGFECRIRGDHHILWKSDVAEIINLQPRSSKAKPYQVKQVRRILRQHRLGLDDEHSL
jgi:predicted RNA binding protein YcfA (HicA-like mRNA interferase family)